MDFTKLKESIIRFEGLELKPYKCPANKLSIGYGRNLEDNGISINEAIYMLENDLLNIKLELEDKLPVFNRLDDIRQNVLLEMAYNMGISKLLNFKKTIQHLKKFDYVEASKEMLDSKWHKDFKKYAPNTKEELLRSSILSKIMKEGKY
ncbi:glycoside hydrolase family protein [Arcobacter aquimarinus]|uniref:glycoside hydrolase family protein n=1 Tax=Arcobacter aquimarinus TaxID=1315211 RepID=UPI003BB17756